MCSTCDCMVYNSLHIYIGGNGGSSNLVDGATNALVEQVLFWKHCSLQFVEKFGNNCQQLSFRATFALIEQILFSFSKRHYVNIEL